MVKVSILVPSQAVITSIEDPRYLFESVNQFLYSSGKKAIFDVTLVGLQKLVKQQKGRYTIAVDTNVKQVENTDLIIIPALSGNVVTALEKFQNFIPWIHVQYKNGAEVASLCAGAFFLAETGLLNGKKCSTHWVHTNTFRKMFPDVEIVDGKIITIDKGIFSSGGANSYWNLLLYLVEKHASREMAVMASKYFAVELNRNSQAPFTIFQGQKEHGDEEIKRIQSYIESNFRKKITVLQLSERVQIPRRTLERRFKKATNNTIIEYVQRIKIEAAKAELETSTYNINEVMYNVGYSDPSAFRKLFIKTVGISPNEYRKKFNRTPVAWV